MLFSCSIRDNIAYGAVDPDAVTTEDVYRAARVANAYNFIQAFPKGFNTVVGEKGVLLSGEKSQHLLHCGYKKHCDDTEDLFYMEIVMPFKVTVSRF